MIIAPIAKQSSGDDINNAVYVDETLKLDWISPNNGTIAVIAKRNFAETTMNNTTKLFLFIK